MNKKIADFMRQQEKKQKKSGFSLEEIAKYNAISVFGCLQEIAGIRFPADRLIIYYEAMLKDLQTGAVERSCKEFDRACRTTIMARDN